MRTVEANRRGTALVTGASSGIGAAIANALAQGGWRVILAARRVDRLAEGIAALGASAFAVPVDVTDSRSVETLLDRLPQDWQAIDVLVNNAGHDIGGRRRFDEGRINEWIATIQTNTIGMLRVTHVLVKGMMERQRGHIINIGSIFGRVANAGSLAYATSKFGVDGFSKALLADLKGSGVRVTQILPGVTRTELSDTRWHGDQQKVTEFYSQFPVVLSPEDVARSVVFVVDQPAHVTISELVIVPT